MHRQKGASQRALAQRRAPSVHSCCPRSTSRVAAQEQLKVSKRREMVPPNGRTRLWALRQVRGANADPWASAELGPEWVVPLTTTMCPKRCVRRHGTAEPPSCHRRRSLMCILMNSASSSSVCDDDCEELSANLCEKEQTDIVQSHIRETTHEKCK